MFYSIVVIGAGGTGGNFLTKLAQFLAGRDKNTYGLVVADGDVFEARNMQRQCLTAEDIGRNKAEVLAEILNDMYDLDISYCSSYVEDKKQLAELFPRNLSYGKTTKILIGCVDNHQARSVMHSYFESEKGVLLYIDAANEFSYGEVVFGVTAQGTVVSPDRAYYFPEVLKKSKPRSQESCTALNSSAPQHLATNMMAANICLSYIADVIMNEVIGVGICHFDAFKRYMRQDDVPEGFVPYQAVPKNGGRKKTKGGGTR